jgi:hypothetical protein
MLNRIANLEQEIVEMRKEIEERCAVVVAKRGAMNAIKEILQASTRVRAKGKMKLSLTQEPPQEPPAQEPRETALRGDHIADTSSRNILGMLGEELAQQEPPPGQPAEQPTLADSVTNAAD